MDGNLKTLIKETKAFRKELTARLEAGSAMVLGSWVFCRRIVAKWSYTAAILFADISYYCGL